jgi:hypothetical protein
MFVIVFEQHNTLRHHGLLASDRANGLARLGLDADGIQRHLQQLSNPLPDRLPMGRKSGTLGEDNAVTICDTISVRLDAPHSFGQEFGRITPTLRRIGVRKQFTDISLSQPAEQGIGQGVQQHVGVAVSNQVLIMRDLNAA